MMLGSKILIGLAVLLLLVGAHDYFESGGVSQADVDKAVKDAVDQYKKDNPQVNNTELNALKTANKKLQQQLDDANETIEASPNATELTDLKTANKKLQQQLDDANEKLDKAEGSAASSGFKVSEDFLWAMAPEGTSDVREGIIPNEKKLIDVVEDAKLKGDDNEERAGWLDTNADAFAQINLKRGSAYGYPFIMDDDGTIGLFVTADESLSSSADMPKDRYIFGNAITEVSMDGEGKAQITAVLKALGTSSQEDSAGNVNPDEALK